jgi:N-acetylmuramoyl-L-alanine amidase
MRRLILPLAATLALLGAPAAGAAVPHTVAPGETLWSIAAANNLYTSALAAHNGLPVDAQVVIGQTLMIPTADEALISVNNAIAAGKLSPYAATEEPEEASAPVAPAAGESAPAPMGGYTVRWGDTLSGLAASAGVPVEQMAAMNGLDPHGVLVAGTVLKLPTGAPEPPQADEPAPEPVVPAADPVPTETRLDAGTVSSVAAQHGVPGSLAAAIAWQESGFNNAMVSSANARGVMQVMPGTWSWIQDNLASGPLDPSSATDNVAAGSLYLDHLLEQTGGDEATAIAAYYQGLSSVQRIGMLPETEQYVANVQALRSRFGG